jgi:DNA replicative helicase MCM subunit Mcm2 (Cdc46/Mcm family)
MVLTVELLCNACLVMKVPAGSLPRTIDVIMRHQAVETANPGDKARFIGMLVVVPDISAMALPGNVSVKSEYFVQLQQVQTLLKD